ncbi:hypothetical protein V6259_12565 [Marinomonas sp. TI.3.20]|uniref:hypothetical protein n=1 Tax=Marinomonas sp. TI.3.20 TaxID=3121296 RepID=UPI00311D603A
MKDKLKVSLLIALTCGAVNAYSSGFPTSQEQKFATNNELNSLASKLSALEVIIKKQNEVIDTYRNKSNIDNVNSQSSLNGFSDKGDESLNGAEVGVIIGVINGICIWKDTLSITHSTTGCPEISSSPFMDIDVDKTGKAALLGESAISKGVSAARKYSELAIKKPLMEAADHIHNHTRDMFVSNSGASASGKQEFRELDGQQISNLTKVERDKYFKQRDIIHKKLESGS